MSVDSRPVSSRVLFGVFTFLLGLAVLLGLTLPPGATAWIIDPPTSPVFNVDNNSDNPVLNLCTDADPEDCSLRGALLVISLYPNTFPLYTINIPAGLGPNEPLGTILLTNGQLEIFTNVKIVGPGADQLTIDAQDNSRVFYVYAAPVKEAGILQDSEHGNADISGLTMTYGGDVYMGGGILVEGGQATLTNCMVTFNSAVKGGGAAVDANGSLTISGGTISFNSACLEGGGIYAGGAPDTLTLTNAAIMNNTAGWSGGGVFVRDSTANLTGCTITDNEAMYSGGGVTAYYGTANIVNCTITGNQVTGEMASGGGGIRVYYGTLTLQDSTLFGNTSTHDGGGISLYGVPGLDGITTALKENTALEDDVPKTLTLTNTTIMNNTALGY
ncbi:MAG: right-handed parallel beta-helix repeat-containing protein, partial [Pseudomonadota bacterium]